jgi:hypothetical protein
MEDWVTIRNLKKKKNPYLGTRKIADLVGISRSIYNPIYSNTKSDFIRTAFL